MADSDRPDEPERPLQDEGELHVFTTEDIADICAEFFVHVREFEDFDDDRAAEAADMMFDLLTGEWFQTDLDDTESNFRYR